MKILILGSEGQIGVPLSENLSWDNEVERFDIAISKSEDLRVKSTHLSESIMRSDYVFFLAFDVGGSRYLSKYQNTPEFISNNIRIMDSVFDTLRIHKKRFMFASSQMSEMPFSQYGTLKLIGEHYARSLGGTSARLWNVFGVERDPEKSHVITDFINMALNTGEIRMRTDGSELRQLLHVDDFCSAARAIMSSDSLPDVVDVSSFEWVSIMDVANIVSEMFGNIPVIPGESVDDVQMNSRKEPRRDILKFWSPKTTLRDGIKKVIEQSK